MIDRRLVIGVLGGVLLLVVAGGPASLLPVPHSEIPPVHASYIAVTPRSIETNDYRAAMERIVSGDGRTALRHLEALERQRPNLAPWIALWKARAEMLAGESAAAVARLEALAADTRGHLIEAALERLVEAHLARGDRFAAHGALVRLAWIQSGDDRRRTEIRRAAVMCETGNDAASRTLLIEVMNARGSAFVSALAGAALVKMNESDPELLARIADLLYEGGDFSNAARLYERLLALPGGARSRSALLLKQGRSLERADEFRAAVTIYRRLLAEHPGFSTTLIRYRTGLCLQRLGADAEGERFLRLVLDEDPRSSFVPDILHRMASLRDRKDRRDEALALYRQLLARHPRSNWAPTAAWRIGMAHVEEGRFDEARAAFREAQRRFPRSDFASAMGYWNARTLELEGKKDEARAAYGRLVRDGNEAYYRVRSATGFHRLGGKFEMADLDRARDRAVAGDPREAFADLRLIRDAGTGAIAASARRAASELLRRHGDWDAIARLEVAPVIDGAGLLFDLGRGDDSRLVAAASLVEIGAINEAADLIRTVRIDDGVRPEARLAAIRILAEGGQYRRAMREVEALVRSLGGPRDPAAMPAIAAHLVFPRFYLGMVEEAAREFDLDPRFILAVIREESRFQEDVASHAGAQGLMQIMPATGAGIARSLGIDPWSKDRLRDPKMNIRMGSYYLRKMLDTYDGRRFLALAGYNAGPGNAGRWLRENPDVVEDLFVERISFRETRNYVKKVLGTYWTYRQIDGESFAEI